MAEQPPSRTRNLAFAAVAGQAGCASLALVIIALFAGLWLDSHFHVRGPFTIGLLIASIPISLFVMVRIALGAINEIKPPPATGKPRESTSHTEED